MTTRVCVAGVTGKVGRGLARAIAASEDLSLVAAVSRSTAGATVQEAIGVAGTGAGASAGISARIAGTVAEALATPCDVLVDYTRPDAVRGHVMSAIERGVHVVVGTSGLTDDDYRAIDEAARARGVGVFAAGNFAITAVLLAEFAEKAARHVPSWEIVDYAYDGKPDAPSGTARELASRLERVRSPHVARPVAETLGEPAARGATLGGAQVHSVRLPGFVSSVEVCFGMPGERLTLRHDSVDPTAPYVGGTLLAVRRVSALRGVVRGLSALLNE
jgi:4-hydroxy-tetrahydrodipicolinate reductase